MSRLPAMKVERENPGRDAKAKAASAEPVGTFIYERWINRSVLLLLGTYAVFLGTNILGFFMGNWVLESFLPDSLRSHFYVYIDSLQDDGLMLGLNIGPFPVMAVLVFLYFLPLWRYLHHPDATELQKIRAQRRILNATFAITTLTVVSWILALSLVQGYMQFTYPEFSTAYRLRAVLVFGMCGMFSSLLSFSAFDYLCRRYFIPWFFSPKELVRIRPWIIPSLSRRQAVGWLGVSLFPIVLLLVYISGLSSWPDNALFVLGTGVFLAGLSFLLAMLSSKTLSLSLDELVGAIKQLQRQNYAVSVPLRSQDEVGILAQGVNQLALSMAAEAQLQHTLGQAVDPQVRDHLLAHPEDWGTQSLNIAVLFCDLRGFTAYSAERSPTEVTQFLNRFFDIAGPLVAEQGGHINKYLGDAFMAVFGAPTVLDDPGKHALQAAQAIWHATRDMPNVQLAMGIHAGPALAGPVGSSQRREYSVIGDTVNTASRLEGMAKSHDAVLVVSDVVLPDGCRDLAEWSNVGDVTLRGRTQALSAWVWQPT